MLLIKSEAGHNISIRSHLNLFVGDDLGEDGGRLVEPLRVGGVDDEDEAVDFMEVLRPETEEMIKISP